MFLVSGLTQSVNFVVNQGQFPDHVTDVNSGRTRNNQEELTRSTDQNRNKGMNIDNLFTVTDRNGAAVFVCNYGNCVRQFSNRSMMLRHIKTHTKEKPFKCRFCNFRCSRKDNLRVHEISHTNINLFTS